MPEGIRPSPEVAQYLLAREVPLAEERRHVVSLSGDIGKAAAVLAVLVLVTAGVPPDDPLFAVLIGGWVVVLAWIGWHLLGWWRERFVVTDRRLLLLTGILTRQVTVMPLVKITDITLVQPAIGRLLGSAGWGTLLLESPGQDTALNRIPHLRHPTRLYRQLTVQFFGDEGLYTPHSAQPGREEHSQEDSAEQL